MEFAKVRAYAMDDALDALALFELFAPPYFYLTRSIPRTFQAVINTASGAQINSYLTARYVEDHHSLPEPSEPVTYEGAISLGNPGLYRNVLKFDVASLYPSVILHHQVNPEKDPLKHFLKMMKEFTAQRLEYKRLYKEIGDPKFKALSEAFKIIINSGYGFMGAQGMLFNSPRDAAFICEKSREYLLKSMHWAEYSEFTLVNADTDSIAFCKGDQSPFSPEERQKFLNELNQLYPKLIQFEDDGCFDAVLVNKAKNYALKEGDVITIKGSALKATNKEPALKEFILRVITALLQGQDDTITTIEQEYLTEIENLTDIRRWSSKKTVTSKVLAGERTQEARILAAIDGTDYQEGDKVYVYFTPDGSLKLAEHWANDHCKLKLLEKLKKTKKVLEGKTKC